MIKKFMLNKIILVKKTYFMCIQKAFQQYHVESNLKHFTEEYEKPSENLSNPCNTNVTQKGIKVIKNTLTSSQQFLS